MIDILKKTELFASFNDKQLKAVIKLGKREIIDKDSELFLKGTKAKGVYIILGGKFTASYNSIKKDYLRGDILSEISLVKEIKHKITLKSSQRSQVFFLSRDKYIKMKDSSPKFALTFQDALLSSLIKKVEKLENIF